ncbi:hypothetical protein ACJRO7_017774 [Eucalyptus globulus]|uniref:PGG domain-containing protein n=1 Tax=Eucalyptus globulus TaxID=34317 RepID=A0ABD3KRB9_EUCGL
MASGLPEKEEREARESRLQRAIARDDVDELYDLIMEEPELLDRVSKHPFPDTLLHIAAAAGKSDVAMEIAILRPSLAGQLTLNGYSPMHLALQHENYQTVRALMALNPELIRVRGRHGLTPLHYITTKEGEVESELLAEFLYACQSSIEDLMNQSETAIHIARVHLTEILNWKDHNGNIVLHIAVYKKQAELIKPLIRYVNRNARNFQKKRALDIFEENHMGNQDVEILLPRASRPFAPLSLSMFLSRELTTIEKFSWLMSLQDDAVRDMILVVSTLIATATYQAALSPPGGYWQDPSSKLQANSSSIELGKPHQAGNIILSGLNLYLFTILNATAFLASIGAIWATIIPLVRGPRLHITMVCVALVILGLAYLVSLLVEFPKSNSLAVILLGGIYMSALGALLILPVTMWVAHRGIFRRLDSPTGSYVY